MTRFRFSTSILTVLVAMAPISALARPMNSVASVQQPALSVTQLCSGAADSGQKIWIDEPTVLRGGSLKIRGLCKVRLRAGGSLAIRGVRIETGSLDIRDSSPNGMTSVSIVDSDLRSTDGGLFVRLQDSQDQVVIQDSSLHFPAGIWIHVSAETTGGEIRVIDSEISSSGEGEGVRLLASGFGGRVEIERSDIDAPTGPLLYADDCVVSLSPGIFDRCGREFLLEQTD